MSTDGNAVPEGVEHIQQTIVEDFRSFDDWMDRYQYLIGLGRHLPSFPEAARIEANRLSGCQAGVWLICEHRDGLLHFKATSDAAILAGLIALLLKVYSGRSPSEILETSPTFIDAIGLSSHLSLNRANGLAQLVARIRSLAAAHVARDGAS
jgi:SufE protein probably involved in Fe-S center assembly